MGFKDFDVFNNALLDKKGWPLIQQEDALWAKGLKGLYLRNCYFYAKNE